MMKWFFDKVWGTLMFALGVVAGAFLIKKFDDPDTVINNNVTNRVDKMKVKGKGNSLDTSMENVSDLDATVDNSKKKEKKKFRLFGKKKK